MMRTPFLEKFTKTKQGKRLFSQIKRAARPVARRILDFNKQGEELRRFLGACGEFAGGVLEDCLATVDEFKDFSARAQASLELLEARIEVLEKQPRARAQA